jgi:hypothetical protein
MDRTGGFATLGKSPTIPAWLEVVVQVGARECLQKSGCTPSSDGEIALDAKSSLALAIDAVVDFRSSIELSGQSRPVRLRQKGVGEAVGRYRLDLGSLETGRHCLLATVVRDVGTVVKESSSGTASATAFLLDVDGADPAHCFAGRVKDPISVQGDKTESCGPPVLSVAADEMSIRRKLSPSDPVWLHIDSCGNSTTSVVLVHDGAIETEGPLAPFQIPAAKGRRVVRLPSLDPGGWYAVSVVKDKPLHTSVSLPLLVAEDASN